jgi:hypothetical protein
MDGHDCLRNQLCTFAHHDGCLVSQQFCHSLCSDEHQRVHAVLHMAHFINDNKQVPQKREEWSFIRILDNKC